MKKTCRALAALALVVMTAQVAAAESDFSLGGDKALHFGMSALLGFGANVVAFTTSQDFDSWERVGVATAVGIIPGTIKELAVDSRFGPGDMTANLLGAFAGAVASEYLNSHIGVSMSGKQWFLTYTIPVN